LIKVERGSCGQIGSSAFFRLDGGCIGIRIRTATELAGCRIPEELTGGGGITVNQTGSFYSPIKRRGGVNFKLAGNEQIIGAG